MTFAGALGYGKELLRQAGVPDYGLDAWYLMEYALSLIHI